MLCDEVAIEDGQCVIQKQARSSRPTHAVREKLPNAYLRKPLRPRCHPWIPALRGSMPGDGWDQ